MELIPQIRTLVTMMSRARMTTIREMVPIITGVAFQTVVVDLIATAKHIWAYTPIAI
jgi:hypothetical protein